MNIFSLSFIVNLKSCLIKCNKSEPRAKPRANLSFHVFSDTNSSFLFLANIARLNPVTDIRRNRDWHGSSSGNFAFWGRAQEFGVALSHPNWTLRVVSWVSKKPPVMFSPFSRLEEPAIQKASSQKVSCKINQPSNETKTNEEHCELLK